jgi:hypothetical protein
VLGVVCILLLYVLKSELGIDLFGSPTFQVGSLRSSLPATM